MREDEVLVSVSMLFLLLLLEAKEGQTKGDQRNEGGQRTQRGK